MKKVYLDNNIFSKLLNDIEFSKRLREIYPNDKFQFYISTGTLSEQYKGRLYNRENIMNSGVRILLNHNDVVKFERDEEKEEKEEEDFWSSDLIRIRSMDEFYNGLLACKYKQLKAQGVLEKVLFSSSEELREEIEKDYFNGINNQSKELLEKFKDEANSYKDKMSKLQKKFKNHENQIFIKNTFTNQGKVKPKDIVVLTSMLMSKESEYKGLFTMSVLKQHRIATLDKELGLNDFYDVIQGFWYPYMDEIIIERKQSVYLNEMRIKEPLKSHLKNVRITNLREIKGLLKGK